MGIQSSTNSSPDLLRMRAAFMGRHALKNFKLSGRSLVRMARSAGADGATVAAIRGRFTYGHGTYLQWSGPTSDHLEMMGPDGRLLVLVSHPYPEPRKDCPDLELFRRAGLRVVIEGKDRSWYGFGTHHVRIEHPAFSGQVARPAPAPSRPTPPAVRHPGESPHDARLRRAAPRLLEFARERAAELAAALRLVPCAGPNGVGPCLACELREDYARLVAVIAEVDGMDCEIPPQLS
jgi:hypothetical protein